jgi:hypothetical protein
MKVEFNYNEFKKRLLNRIPDEIKVNIMILLYDRYFYCLGLTDQPFDDLFSTQEEMKRYKELFEIKENEDTTYSILQLEKVFQNEIGIGPKEAQAFSEVEEQYLKDIGVMLD